MARKRKTKAARRARRRVERADRVVPPPEAAQHHKPWPLMVLLHRGPEAEGVDADEFEAAIEIVETFKAITAGLQIKGTTIGDPQGAAYAPGGSSMSDRSALMTEVWFTWCRDVGPVATQIVEQIEDTVPIRSAVVLRLALQRWLKVKRDIYRRNMTNTEPQHVVDSVPSHMLTMNGALFFATGAKGHASPLPHPPPRSQQIPNRPGAPAQAAPRSVTTKR